MFELIAVILAGVAAGGCVLVVRRLVPAVPRWIIPAAGGAAMLAASVSLDYSWFARNAAALPDEVRIATTHEVRVPWRPWTYLVPYVDRFIAVDRANLLTNDTADSQRLASLYVFGRWTPTRRVRAVFDCAGGRRADLVSTETLAEDGTVRESAWIRTAAGDPVARIVCEGA